MSTALARRVREHLAEPRPAPEPMTDTEILDWLNEYCDGYESSEKPPLFTVFFWDETASGSSLREAVCNAAAIWKELNK